jgi:hypothetical protein
MGGFRVLFDWSQKCISEEILEIPNLEEDITYFRGNF